MDGDKRNRPAWPAFTLIELLVVMAVMTILMGIILPAVTRAREHARRAQCASNLSQVGKALVLYSNVFQDWMPSYPEWGQAQCAYRAMSGVIRNYAGHQGASRHLPIAVSGEVASPAADLPNGGANFVPVGLGFLIDRDDIGAEVVTCPSMAGSVETWYGSARYAYTSQLPRLLGSQERRVVTAGGAGFMAADTAGGMKTVAILSSYAYRDTPFYSRLKPDNAPTGWTYVSDHPSLADSSTGWVAQWRLPFVKPARNAEFMTPPFKTVRALGGRAVAADAFDTAPSSSGGAFPSDGGLGRYAHGDGYTALYGDGHAQYHADEERRIGKWSEWADPANTGCDNLTISSPTSHKVWNLFDRAMKIDEE
ncbi:MAG TPA: type II secretion system protein [Candidatus Brocadiia bacterium]|nr:type II secretion system protein [Candidatus Brocadiia bacterium]